LNLNRDLARVRPELAKKFIDANPNLQPVLDLDPKEVKSIFDAELREHKLIHEHVISRKELTDRLLKGEKVVAVLKAITVCIVTHKEHVKLSKVTKHVEGWNRYKEAKIEVLDTWDPEKRPLEL
jgi:hypothetical protein